MQKEIFHDTANKSYSFECPHCNCFIQVDENQVNCQIFRHGVLKQTWAQISPHLQKDECDRLASNDLIYGCGKPFRIFAIDGKWSFVKQCGYI